METIKEEKKADLEQLLNSLIEKGWKPFGRNYQKYENGCLIREFTTEDGVYSYGQYPTTLREFCAKESGLWQFVCENGMVDVKDNRYDFFEYYKGINEEGAFRDAQRYDESYEYRLIETALTDEDKLEQFLLNSIKLD